MSASDFLRRLDVQLRQLPPGERENALAYYRDYFADAANGIPFFLGYIIGASAPFL